MRGGNRPSDRGLVMRGERHRQRDLFEPQETTPLLQAPLQAKLAPLLQALLTEAAAIERVRCDNRETGDDQDNP
jgi:hypothetical protein